jgi:hypothetical protein
VWTPPLRKLTPRTSRGFEAVAFARDVLGIDLFPWQRWLLIHLLELLPDGSYRFRTAVVLVARQNGKTTLMQILALWRMYVDGANLVIGTAQNLDVAEEAWTGAVEMAEGVPELAAEIAAVDRTNGKKALRLESGERYKVAAASRRGGRGLSGDLVLLDELREHQTWDAWGAVTKTTMARPNPQILCLSNAGDEMSVVLEHLRQQGYATVHGEGERSLGIFEWSAPPECALDDRAGWRQANPALGYASFGEASILAALATDPEQVFRTEVLCQHVAAINPRPIDGAAWRALEDPASTAKFVSAYGLEVSLDRAFSAVGVAGPRGDGRIHVELLPAARGGDVFVGRGTGWVVTRCAEINQGNPGVWAVDGQGEAAGLVPELEKAGLKVVIMHTSDVAAASSGLAEAVKDKTVSPHGPRPELVAAVDAAKKKPLNDGKFVLSRRISTGDITGLLAVRNAHWATDLGYDVLGSAW